MDWRKGQFKESPDIIEYIKNVWNKHSLKELKDSEAGEENRIQRLGAEDFISGIVEHSKGRLKKVDSKRVKH